MTDLLCKEGNFCQIHVLLDKKMLKFVFEQKYVNFLKLEWEESMSGKKTSSWQQILNRTFLHLNF